MKASIAKLLNESRERIGQADDWTSLADAVDTLLAAVVEIARELPDTEQMTTKQRDHARAAFDRGFPGEAVQ